MEGGVRAGDVRYVGQSLPQPVDDVQGGRYVQRGEVADPVQLRPHALVDDCRMAQSIPAVDESVSHCFETHVSG
jgi:hypothetical protein